MAKDANSIAETASAFFLAKKHMDDHESSASDADTSIRNRKQKAVSLAKAALRRSKDLAARQRKRLADAAEERTDVGDVAVAGDGCVTPWRL